MINLINYNYLEKQGSYLTRFVGLIIAKRSMQAAGSLISVAQKQSAIKMLTLHTEYTKKCTLNPENFINFSLAVAPINFKIFQHIFSCMYPKITFPISLVRQKFPNLGVHNADFKDHIDFDHLVATIAASLIKDKPPLANAPFYSIGAPDKTRYVHNSPAYKDTKQPNPDYEKTTGTKILWSRFMDLKTGKIHSNRGHIYITSDLEDYENRSEVLLRAQYKLCHEEYPDTELTFYLYYLLHLPNNEANWGKRNDLFKEFIVNHLQDYPSLNPSLIFKAELTYKVKNTILDKDLEGYINTSSFSSEEETARTLAHILHAGGPTVTASYLKFSPIGLVAELLKTLF